MVKSFTQYLIQTGVLSLLFAFHSCTSQKEEQQQATTVSVRTLPITYDSSAVRQEYVGIAESRNAVDISFLVVGNIEQTYVHEGDKVSKGQKLAGLNTTSLKKAHELSLATLKQAQDAYKRVSAMYENKSLPEIQFVDVKTKLEQAEASEAIARKSLSDCIIYAPQAGVVSKRYLEPGANVMPGTPVYNIMDISTVKIKSAIPEGEISKVKIGTKCLVKISALDDETFKGIVVEKGITANPISHTYDIRTEVVNTGGSIMPGMVCKSYLSTTAAAAKQVFIPIKAVQVNYSGNRFVWIKNKQSKAEYRQVVLGNLSENGVEIKSGLLAGEEVIIAGYQNISEGTPVSENR